MALTEELVDPVVTVVCNKTPIRSVSSAEALKNSSKEVSCLVGKSQPSKFLKNSAITMHYQTAPATRK